MAVESFDDMKPAYALAFDTANEVVAVGLGKLDAASRSVELVASLEVEAHRASNTQLLPRIDSLLVEAGVSRDRIACVCVGRGPGSFTGVRIAMATAKGIASALGVALVGVSSLDVVAWNAWSDGVRGPLAVVADAMRREVYPVRYEVGEAGVRRLEADRVVKAQLAAEELAAAVAPASNALGESVDVNSIILQLAGDGLKKYAELFEPAGVLLPENLWAPTGAGLLLALQAAWRAGEADPFDARRHNPGFLLPVYTRLSDAEENERIRLAKNDPKNLATGVQDVAPRRDQRATMHDTAVLNARPDAQGITYKPLDAAHAADVAAMESQVMGSDAWNAAQVADELPRTDRTWWAAYAPAGGEDEAFGAGEVEDSSGSCSDDCVGSVGFSSLIGGTVVGAAVGAADAPDASDAAAASVAPNAAETAADNNICAAGPDGLRLVGYAGGFIVDGDVQILKIGTESAWRRRGIARQLISRVASDARDLGAKTVSLEVRVSNTGAQAFYETLGMHQIGKRPRYYSDREDAVIMEGALEPLICADASGAASSDKAAVAVPASVAGMRLQVDEAHNAQVALNADAQKSLSLGEADEGGSAGERAGFTGEGPGSAVEGSASAPAAAASATSAPTKLIRPLILAIESSCDETAAAIVDGEGNLLSDVVASQIDFHARFGGVVPEIASRKHIEAICGVCDECLEVAAARLGIQQLTWADLDGVGVTYAPGLVGALVVGVAFAKGAAWGASKPLIGVNHLEGHLYANKIGAPDFAPPAVVSLVSGGNTMLVHMRDWGSYKILGTTIDDAVGEAFDKVAKALGLGYPGGPVVSAQGAQGDPKAIAFPRAMMHSGDMRFSLSGLKTAVVTYINNERAAGRPLNVPDICASFEAAVVDVQVKKAEMALRQTGARTFCLGGGVAANPMLRSAYEKLCAKLKVRLVMPPLKACGDNAGMIALVALDRFRQQRFYGLDADACAHANLEKPY
jgi:bifunctional N6-L-threonylcarbamoyladenine synthase / protein kinase Bud32